MGAECVIAWETRVSVGIAKQGASSGDQESEWTVQTVGAATCLLMKKEPVAQGVSEEDNTEAFSTKIDSMQVPFAPTMGADGESKNSQAKYMSISRMQYYNKYSFEEIQVGDYLMQLARADRGEPASSLINVASSAATNGPAAADKSTDDDQASSSVSVQPPESVVLTQFYPGPGTVTQQWAKTTGPDGAPNTTNNSNGLYMAITAMPAYQNYSFDELRVQDYGAGRTKPKPFLWRSDGYSGSENLPCPTLHSFCVGHQSTKGADATDPSGTAKSKESPEADRERIVGSVATCRRALSEKEPVIQFQLIAPLVNPSPEPQSADIHVRQVPQEYHLGFSEESAPVVVESLAEAVTNPNPFLAHDWKTREVEFRSGFKTMRSRQRCPDKKAAYYEIEIVSPVHNPQFGFCDAQFSPSSNHGTGDCKHSWAVDGHRGLLWHDGKQAWNLAHKWNVGDVIGIACDLVKGELSVSLNGSFAPPYGVLFSGVARNSQASASVDGLFASFTASSGKVRYNLGAPTPFKFLPPAPTELFLSREIFQPFSAFPLVSLPPRPGIPTSERVFKKASSQSAGQGRKSQKAASPSSERVFSALEAGAASWRSTFGSISMGTSADSAPAASCAAPATGGLGSLGGAGKFDNAGAEIKVLRSFGSKGSGAGQFNGTRGVAVDGSGNIFVADKDNGRVQVFDADGRLVLSFGSKGSGQGQFQWPLGVAVDGKGHVVVADAINHTVQVFDVQGGFVRSFGKKGTGDGEFNGPRGVACGPQGEIFVADYNNHCVKVFDASGRFLRRIGQKGSANGELNTPSGLALDAHGNLVVAEQHNKRVHVLGPEGQFVRVIGHGQLETPWYVAVDPHGLIVVSDYGKHCVWVFDEEGALVQRFGERGSASGQLIEPWGVAVDAWGNIVVADGDNHRVQVFQGGAQQRGTILHVAAEAGARGGMCRVLLDHCSELEACESSGGVTARQIAEQRGHTEVVEELDAWAAERRRWEEGSDRDREKDLREAARTNDVTSLQRLLNLGVVDPFAQV